MCRRRLQLQFCFLFERLYQIDINQFSLLHPTHTYSVIPEVYAFLESRLQLAGKPMCICRKYLRRLYGLRIRSRGWYDLHRWYRKTLVICAGHVTSGRVTGIATGKREEPGKQSSKHIASISIRQRRIAGDVDGFQFVSGKLYVRIWFRPRIKNVTAVLRVN